MTFLERYNQEDTWQGRVMIMELYHLAMTMSRPKWTITQTAQQFGVSVGLASENLRLAEAIHAHEKLLKCESRQAALNYIRG